MYLGIPSLPADASYPWLPDMYAFETVLKLIARTLVDFKFRYGTSNSLAGFYETFEIFLPSINTDEKMMQEGYGRMNKMIKETLPGRKFFLSPYQTALRSQNQSMDVHKSGFMTLARTGVDIIAIQEGRGGGAVGYFFHQQNNTRIKDLDPLLHKMIRVNMPSVKDNITYTELYIASTRDMFKMYREAATELKDERNSITILA
jgi:hypothetical protein